MIKILSIYAQHVVYLGQDYHLCNKTVVLAVDSTVCIDYGHLPRHFVQVDMVICVLQVQSSEILATGGLGV